MSTSFLAQPLPTRTKQAPTWPARTWIELNAEFFEHNISTIKNIIGDQQMAIVLKSNGYGHGIYEMSKLAAVNKNIDWICVAGLSEAVSLREVGINKRILVLAYLDDHLEYVVQYDIHCAVFDYETACKLNTIGQQAGRKIAIHIKVDTGMSRLGVMPDEILSFIKQVALLPAIDIHGIFTHLCDSSNEEFSVLQLHRFDTMLDQIAAFGIAIPCIHALSSSGLHIPTKRAYTMVRIGASAYGLAKSAEHQALQLGRFPTLNLQSIMSWKTHILLVKHIEKNAYVGYNRTFQAPHAMRIAILPIGYYEGYPRILSGKSLVYIENEQAPVIGVISMNLMTVDITHIPQATEKSEVLLVGDFPHISAYECAQKAGLITNEFVASLQSSITRIITHEKAIHEDNANEPSVSYPRENEIVL